MDTNENTPDELENDIAQENNEINTADESQNQSALDVELENIRDMFQKELNGEDVSYTAIDGEPLIQSLEDMGLETENNEQEDFDEDSETEEEEIPEDELCEYCEKNRKDTSFGEDYPYCSECREKMKKNPFNAAAVLVTLLMIAMVGALFGFMAKDIDSYTALLDAQTAYSSGHIATAIYSYDTYLSSVNPDGSYSKSAIKNYIKSYDAMGYITNAIQTINEYFTEDDLAKKSNKDILEIQQRGDRLESTAQFIQNEFYSVLVGDDFDYKKTIKSIDKTIADNLESGNYDQTYLEFLKYIIMYTNGDSNDKLIKQLLKVRDTDVENGEKTTWLYITHIISAYAKSGDDEKAKEFFDIATKLNSQDLGIYASYSDVYRFALTAKSTAEEASAAGDKILEIAEEAARNFEQAMSYPTYFRIYAMGYLLKGEYDMAKENMDNFVQSCSGASTTSDLELYAACCIAAKDKDTYKSVKAYLESQGYEFSAGLKKYAAGKTDILKLLTDKEGNI